MEVWGNEFGPYAGIAQKSFDAAGAFIVQHLLLRGGAAVGEVGVEDARGSYEFSLVMRGEWLR